jgi:hypothetical protein
VNCINEANQNTHGNPNPTGGAGLSISNGMNVLVRKGGFEPPRLSAPPPQDGVSASSTTSACCNCHALNILARSASEGNSDCTASCIDLCILHASLAAATFPPPGIVSRPIFVRMHIGMLILNVIVARHVEQREWVGVPRRKERVLQHVQARIRAFQSPRAVGKKARSHSSRSHFTAQLTNVGQASTPPHRLLGDRLETEEYAGFALQRH